jgi:hypothetical protein
MPIHYLFALIFVLSFGSSAIAQDDDLLDRSKNSLNIHLSGEITPTAGHPYAGFWKEDCSKESGLAIAHAGRGLYSVSFCGPGGCFKPGTYRPNTPLVGDKLYQVKSHNRMLVKRLDGFKPYKRCWPAL